MKILHGMGVLHRVEVTGIAGGARAVRLVFAGGETRALYREGGGGDEALVALGLPSLAESVAGCGPAAVALGADDGAPAMHAALAFLRQRGSTRVVVVGEGPGCVAALHAGGEAEAVALVSPRAPALEAPPVDVPVLVVVPPGLDLLAAQLCRRLPRARCVAAAESVRDPLLRSFVLDALTRPARALDP